MITYSNLKSAVLETPSGIPTIFDGD